MSHRASSVVVFSIVYSILTGRAAADQIAVGSAQVSGGALLKPAGTVKVG